MLGSVERLVSERRLYRRRRVCERLSGTPSDKKGAWRKGCLVNETQGMPVTDPATVVPAIWADSGVPKWEQQ